MLLPLTGGQAAAASAVRDGFLSGYYGETRRKPAVRFYDTAGGAKAFAGAFASTTEILRRQLRRPDCALQHALD